MMRKSFLWLIAACGLLPLMISSQSFWIDECGSARFACAPSWQVFWELMRVDLESDSQMPLFMLFSRIWHLIVGRTEYALRSINILFGVLSITGAFFVAKKLQIRPWLMVGLLVFHPFLWAYMDEFRPYVMQIAGGWLMVLALLQMRDADHPGLREAAVFSVAAVLLVGSSLLGAVPLAVFGGVWGILFLRKIRNCTKGFWGIAGLIALFTGVFGLFYLSKMLHGGGGSKSWSPGLGNVAFSLYELLGFSGLGPGRADLRAAAAAGAPGVSVRAYLPGLSALICTYGLLFLEMIRMPRVSRKEALVAAGLAGAGISALFLLALVFQWPFWGRHLAPFFPALMVACVLLVGNMLARSPKMGMVALCAMLVLLGVSSLNVRLSSRFAKDDYRCAYQIIHPVIDAGGVVWWAANPASSFYYHVVDSPMDPLPDNMLYVANRFFEDLRGLPWPDVVILSKPALYDKKHGLRKYLEARGFKKTAVMQAMEVWKPTHKP